MNQGFWMAKGAAESINDGEINYDNSARIDAKRSHQWFMDAAEAELFPNKKQAVGGPTNNFFTGLLNSNIYPWPNASGFQPMSGHCSDRLFDSEASRTVNSDDRNIPSASSEKGHMERKLDEDPFGNDSSFGLSMSHTLEDPRSCLNYGGIRKVKVSQVKEPENVMPVSMEPAYNRMDGNTMSAAHAYSKTDENTMSMNLAYSKGEGNIMTIGDTYGENNIFISMGQPYHKEDDSVSMAQAYKENNTTLAMGHAFRKGDSNIISVAQTYNMPEENPILVGHIYGKGNENYIPTCQSHNKGDNSNVSLAQSCNKGESTMISFGSYDEDDANTSGRLIPNYGLLIAQSSLQQRPDVTNEGDLVNSNVDVILSNALGAQNASRKKEDPKTSKKATPNSFPSNVRSLLSTGMLDGVPVKYIAWSKEKELRGVIRGSGYLCGCQSCNYAKVVNAYEFERHANCKTKHPNNHIYFENGKTIYAIVQELRSTPQNMLFEVIQTITGSPINQKSFRLWKESFLAATRELQRIYGPDDGKPL